MLKPIDARVIVKATKQEEETASGIILPDTIEQGPQMGDVISVGPGSRNMMNGEVMPMSIEVGDNIIFNKFSGIELVHKGEDVLVLMEKDIIAVVTEED